MSLAAPESAKTRSIDPVRRLSYAPSRRVRRDVDRMMRKSTPEGGKVIDLPLLAGRHLAGERRRSAFQIGPRRVTDSMIRRACHLVLTLKTVDLGLLTRAVENSSAVAAIVCVLFRGQIQAKRTGRWVLCLVVQSKTVCESGRGVRVEIRAGKPSPQLIFDVGPPLIAQTLLFHVMSGGSNLHGWDMAPDPIPTLISLGTWSDRKNSLQTERAAAVIAKKCRPLLLDSGRLTWMKKGLRDWARRDLTDIILRVGEQLGADILVAGDVPMEPGMLANVGLTAEEALSITWAANESLRTAPTGAVRGYVIQGYDMDLYEQSIEAALSSPQVEDVLSGRAAWIIGSVCMAPPEKVLAVANLVRSRLPGTIHMLGQGRPEIIRQLRGLGIAWADSGTAAGYAGNGKWLYPSVTNPGHFGWKRLHDGRKLPPEAYGLLVRNNMEVMELCLAG